MIVMRDYVKALFLKQVCTPLNYHDTLGQQRLIFQLKERISGSPISGRTGL